MQRSRPSASWRDSAHSCRPGGLAPGLQEWAVRGIVRHGEVLTWADSTNASNARRFPGELSRWERDDSSFHVEDFVPVDVATIDDAPVITEDDQRILLLHALAFALEFSKLVYALEPPAPVRCTISAGETNGTFRFHQIRPDEDWNTRNLDLYRQEKMIEIDIEPFER